MGAKMQQQRQNIREKYMQKWLFVDPLNFALNFNNLNSKNSVRHCER